MTSDLIKMGKKSMHSHNFTKFMVSKQLSTVENAEILLYSFCYYCAGFAVLYCGSFAAATRLKHLLLVPGHLLLILSSVFGTLAAFFGVSG